MTTTERYVDLNTGTGRNWPINEILMLDYICRSVPDGDVAYLHGVEVGEVVRLRAALEI